MTQCTSNDKRAQHTILFSLIGNLFLAIIKFTTGLVGNSFALIADSIESAGDVFSSLII